MPAGPVDLTWNGQNQDGEDMPAGQYRFEFVANKDGNLTTLPLLNKQRIAAVSWDKEIGELKIEMEDRNRNRIEIEIEIESKSKSKFVVQIENLNLNLIEMEINIEIEN